METSLFNKRSVSISMMFLYFILGGTQFVGFSYLPIYLTEMGFNNNTLGGVVAFAFIVSMFTQPIWGALADHAKTKNRILLIAVLGIAISIWLLILPKHVAMLTLLPSIAIVYTFLFVPATLADTIVVENLHVTGLRFGTIKCFASGGAAFMSLLTYLISLFADMRATTAYILLSFSVMITLIPLAFIPPTQGHARRDFGKKIALGNILKNKRLMLLLSFALFHFLLVQCANTYLSVYYSTDQGLNAGVGSYGLFFAVCIALETTVMIVFTKTINRVNIYNIFILSGVAGCIRSFIVFLAPNAYIMLFCAIFHALMFGPLWVRLAPYIGKIVPDEMRATGMASWFVIQSGLAPVAGSILGGMLSGLVVVRNIFLLTSALLLLNTFVFFFIFRHQRIVDLNEGFETEEF